MIENGVRFCRGLITSFIVRADRPIASSSSCCSISDSLPLRTILFTAFIFSCNSVSVSSLFCKRSTSAQPTRRCWRFTRLMTFSRHVSKRSRAGHFAISSTITCFSSRGAFKSHFPNAFSYNRFIELESRVFFPLMLFLNLRARGRCAGITFVDSTMIPVCHDLRRYETSAKLLV